MEDQLTMDSELKEILNLISTGGIEQMVEINDPSNHFESIASENFQHREDLLGGVRRIALMQGYAIVIRKSKPNKYVIIGCDRGGNYRGTDIPIEQRKRKTSSRLINCPFEIWGKKKPDGFWKLEIKTLLLNHEPSTDMSGHPSCR